MNECVKCGKEAEFDSPALLCEDHWVEWWVDGLEPKDEEERKRFTQETKDNINGPPLTEEERREIDAEIGLRSE